MTKEPEAEHLEQLVPRIDHWHLVLHEAIASEHARGEAAGEGPPDDIEREALMFALAKSAAQFALHLNVDIGDFQTLCVSAWSSENKRHGGGQS